MAPRSGTLLENNVAQILKLAGLSPQVNTRINGYEIDVFLKYDKNKIGIECKQYERSTLAVRNLIHQWDSKNKELNFDSVVLVIVGTDISSKDYELARKYGITIWNQNKLSVLFNEVIEKKVDAQKQVLKELGLKIEDKKPVLIKKKIIKKLPPTQKVKISRQTDNSNISVTYSKPKIYGEPKGFGQRLFYDYNTLVAVLLNFFLPGLGVGQIYRRHFLRGIGVFLFTIILVSSPRNDLIYFLFFLFWIWNIYDAYKLRPK